MSGTKINSETSQSGETALTEKQAKILGFIEAAVAQQGCPPTVREIARAFGYSAVGTVEDHVKALVRKGYLTKEKGDARGLRLSHHAESVSVPILGSVPAGRPIEAIEDSQGSLAVCLSRGGRRLGRSRAAVSEGSDLFALRVRGESMIDAGIHDGDYVIVRKQHDAEDGEIVVAMIDGEATVKTLEKKHGRMRLLPANSRFAPIELSGSRESFIQGKVVSLQRFY